VVLTDHAGVDCSSSLVAGTEVEILAWQPRGSSGTRYRVRSTRDGLEGWLAAGNLRRPPSPVAPKRSKPAAAVASPARVRTQKAAASAGRRPQRRT
jgi:hypothetical protein